MANIINAFPVLTKKRITKMGLSTDGFSFTFEREGVSYPLITEDLENNGNYLALKDENGMWNKEKDNISIYNTIKISNKKSLFGEDGLACSDAEIGIALQWFSHDSKQRSVVQIDSFTKDSEKDTFQLSHSFEKAQFRGDISFLLLLYIKTPGTPKKNEDILANTPGTILGFLTEKITISFDGSGSVFPIFEITEEDGPLWKVFCSWTDPTVERFSECVAININNAHENYEKLKTDKQLLVEVMSSALVCIIQKLKEFNDAYWSSIIKGENLEDGSVGSAVHYFINALEWDPNSPELLSLSIRRFFERKV